MSRPTQVVFLTQSDCVYRTVTVYGRIFQIVPLLKSGSFEDSYNTAIAVTTTVWALSGSIATTTDIDISFSSSGY